MPTSADALAVVGIKPKKLVALRRLSATVVVALLAVSVTLPVELTPPSNVLLTTSAI
ncbi:MAG: hypothetical protein HN719_08865 [Alphaproteobacteria bacterium]|nr:hypothetical protein [Alphaproteobacteria bacterium]